MHNINAIYQKVLIGMIFFILASLLNLTGCTKSSKSQFPVAEKTIEPKLKIVAFYEKGWSEDTSGIANLKKYHQYLDTLSPYWYTLTEGGEVITAKVGFEPEVEKFVMENKELKLMPLINNAKTGDYTMLQNPRVRAEAVSNIIKLVQKHNYAGVNIDFQQIPPETKDGMTALITELHQKLAPMQKLVAVSVLPKLDGLEDLSAAYDYASLAKQADFITIMTYDKHSEQDNSGSIAPLSWVEKNIIEALKYIPKEKLLLCVGAYGYDWPAGKNGEYLGLREILGRSKEQGAKIQFDQASKSAFFNYTDQQGRKHKVWFENGESVKHKTSLAKKYKLRGIAIWRMGFEDDDYWEKLLAVIQ